MNTPRITAFFLLALGIPLSALASVSASLNHNQIASGESVQLTLERDGQSDSQPDLSPLAKDFRILGTSRGTSVQIINGQMSSKTEVSVTLVPNQDGKLKIPALQWGNDTSSTLELAVGGSVAPGQANETAADNPNHVFFDAKLDRRQSYVNGVSMLTLRLFTDRALSQASLDFASNSDVQVRQIGGDRQTAEIRNGHTFQVIERQYMLLPQRSGHLTLPGPILNARIAEPGSADPLADDSFFNSILSRMQIGTMFNQYRPYRLQGKPVLLEVQARPAQIEPKDWLPATGMAITESLQPRNQAIHVGEPLTLHVHIQAEDTVADKLPDLAALISLPDGAKAYPDQPKLHTQISNGSVSASRDQDIALIASRPGTLTVPGMKVPYWDEAHNSQRYVELAAQTTDILPAINPPPGAAIAPPKANQAPVAQAGNVPGSFSSSKENPWLWASVGLFTLLVAAISILWRIQRKGNSSKRDAIQVGTEPDKSSNMTDAMRNFQQAAQENDALNARKHLLAWSKARWPVEPPIGLRSLGERMHDATIETLLNELDRACYTKLTWNGKTLASAMKSWRESIHQENAKAEIADLYF